MDVSNTRMTRQSSIPNSNYASTNVNSNSYTGYNANTINTRYNLINSSSTLDNSNRDWSVNQLLLSLPLSTSYHALPLTIHNTLSLNQPYPSVHPHPFPSVTPQPTSLLAPSGGEDRGGGVRQGGRSARKAGV